jgi:serralysin
MATQQAQSSTPADPYINALLWGGWHWQDTVNPGDGVVVNYFLDTFNGRAWSPAQSAAIGRAFESWSSVANITFVEVANSNDAQMIERLATNATLPGLLGEHGTPDSNSTGPSYDDTLLLGSGQQVYGYYNVNSFRSGGFSAGGYDQVTLIHELGHGIGLAHPHDDGGGSGVFPGVTINNSSSLGSNKLNQGLYTVMSYNDGWASVQDPYGHGLRSYGYETGPMAFDIAAIQYIYGANTTAHNGDDVYLLPPADAAGIGWTCLWDTGGTDSIEYAGRLNTRIDLRPATLDDTPTGGGVVSGVRGVYGGFTVAHGVDIENASSGRGNDVLTGNDLVNHLNGNAGNDVISGGDGNDMLMGGAGRDTMTGGDGMDQFVFANSASRLNIDRITDFEAGIDTIALSQSVFHTLTQLGTLDAGQFALNAAADADDHVIYRESTGYLIYDVNGSGRGGAYVIAVLGTHLSLTAADIIVV